MTKGKIACCKQFVLFSQCFPQLYFFNASKCNIVCNGLINFLHADDDTRIFCGQRRSRSDCTERAV